MRRTLSLGASLRLHTASKLPGLPKLRTAAASLTAFTIALALLPTTALAGDPNEFSCQASGSLLIFLDPPVLERGFPVDLRVSLLNTSTTNPIPEPVLAELNDELRVILACADNDCTIPLPGILTFEGCTPEPGVASCALDPGDATDNRVLIELEPAGLPLELSTATLVAVIHARASMPVPPEASPTGTFFVRGGTNMGAIMTTDDRCDPQVEGEAGESVTAIFPIAPFIEIDKFCGLCDPNSDPANQSVVELTITNSGGSDATQCVVRDIYDPGGENLTLLDTPIEDVPPGATIQLPPFMTPPHTEGVENRATIVCAEVGLCDTDPNCQTTDVFTTECACEPPGGFCPPLDKNTSINPF